MPSRRQIVAYLFWTSSRTPNTATPYVPERIARSECAARAAGKGRPAARLHTEGVGLPQSGGFAAYGLRCGSRLSPAGPTAPVRFEGTHRGFSHTVNWPPAVNPCGEIPAGGIVGEKAPPLLIGGAGNRGCSRRGGDVRLLGELLDVRPSARPGGDDDVINLVTVHVARSDGHASREAWKCQKAGKLS